MFSKPLAFLALAVNLAVVSAQFQTCGEDKVSACCNEIFNPKEPRVQPRLDWHGVDVTNVTGVVGYDCEEYAQGNSEYFWCPGSSAVCCSNLQDSRGPDRHDRFPNIGVNCEPPTAGPKATSSNTGTMRGQKYFRY
ncbi:hypothetical protein NP233_g8639 [Leucocoprinus birnbaumii]|uniref:Hydrophobin n=1 Tax=Leucocoprinus birnbaumii TaxID=56174 RepID=A0AAD5VLY5_9AGAR|nr:hypothetical protein NP233_g8639 [Leucocoprinus birnbaumii]